MCFTAAVFTVGSRAHQFHGLLARTFCERHPRVNRKNLFLRSSCPVCIFGFQQRFLNRLEGLDLALGAGNIAAPRHAETAREANQGIAPPARSVGTAGRVAAPFQSARSRA